MSTTSYDWRAPCRPGDPGMAGYFLNRSLYGSGAYTPDANYFPRLQDHQYFLIYAAEEDPANATTAGDALISTFSRRCCLSNHTGCVNSIEYNQDCSLLLTGSDDRQVCIYDARDQWKHLATIPTAHQQNIFSAQMMPETSNRTLITCGLDGAVIVTDTETLHTNTIVKERFTMASKVLPIGGGCHCPHSTYSPAIAVSIFDDGNLHFLDTRDMKIQLTRQFRKIPLTDSLSPPPLTLTSIVQHPHNSNIIAVGTDESYVSLCDLRYLSNNQASFKGRGGFLNISALRPRDGKKGVGGVAFSEKGDRLLINYKDAPLFNVEWAAHMGSQFVSTDHMSSSTLMSMSGITPFLRGEKPPTVDEKSKKVRGYFATVMGDDSDDDDNESSTDEDTDGMVTAFSRNVLMDQRAIRMSDRQNMVTMFKEPIFLLDDRFVATGSDDGFVYFWETESGILVHRTKLDSDIVNGVLYHPSHPNTLISCGIDRDVKISAIHPIYSHSDEATEPLRSRNLIGEKRPRDHPLFQQTLFVSTGSINQEICRVWAEALEMRAAHDDDYWAPVPGVLNTTLTEKRAVTIAKFPPEVKGMTFHEATSYLFDLMGRGGYSDPIVKHALLQWMFSRLLAINDAPRRQRILFALGVHMPVLSFREKAQILRRFDVTGEVLSTMPIFPLSMRPKQDDDPEVDTNYSLCGWWGVVCEPHETAPTGPTDSDQPPSGTPGLDEYYDDARDDEEEDDEEDEWSDDDGEEGEYEEGEEDDDEGDWEDEDEDFDDEEGDWEDEVNTGDEDSDFDYDEPSLWVPKEESDEQPKSSSSSSAASEDQEATDADKSKIVGRIAVVKKYGLTVLPPVCRSRITDVPSEYFPSRDTMETFAAFGLDEDIISAFSAGGVRYVLPMSCSAPFLSEENEYPDTPAVRLLVQIGSRAESLGCCIDYWLSPSPRGPIMLTHAELLFMEHQVTMLRACIRTPLLTDVSPPDANAHLSKARKKLYSTGDTLGAMECHMSLIHDMNQLLLNPLCANITRDSGEVMNRTAQLLKVPTHAFSGFDNCEPLDALGRSVRAVRRFLRNMSPLVVYQPDKEVADGRSHVMESALTPHRRVDGRYTTKCGEPVPANNDAYFVPVERTPGQLFDFKMCGEAASTSTPKYLVERHGRPLRTNNDIKDKLDDWDSRRPTTRLVGGVAGEVMSADPKSCISRHSRDAVYLSRDVFNAALSTVDQHGAYKKKPKSAAKSTKAPKASTNSSAAAASSSSASSGPGPQPPHVLRYFESLPFATRVPLDYVYLRRFSVAQEIRSLILGCVETQVQYCFGSGLHTRLKMTNKSQNEFISRLKTIRTKHPEVSPILSQIMLQEATNMIKNKNATPTALPKNTIPVEKVLDGNGPSYGQYFTEEEKRLFGEEEWMDVARYRAIIMNRSPLYYCDPRNGIDAPRTFIPLTVEQYHNRYMELYGENAAVYAMAELQKSDHEDTLMALFKKDDADKKRATSSAVKAEEADQGKGKKISKTMKSKMSSKGHEEEVKVKDKKAAKKANTSKSKKSKGDDEDEDDDDEGPTLLKRQTPPRNTFEQQVYDNLREDFEDPNKHFIFDYLGEADSYGSTGGATHHIHSVIVTELMGGSHGFPVSSIKSHLHAEKMKETLRWSGVDSGVHPLAFVMTPDELQQTPNPALDAVKDLAAINIKRSIPRGPFRDKNMKAMEEGVKLGIIPPELYLTHRPKDDLKNWVRYSQVMEQAVCNLETLLWAMYRLLIIMKERDGINIELAWDRVQADAIPEIPRLTEAALREHQLRRAHDFKDDDDPDGGLRQIRMRSFRADGEHRDYEPTWADMGHPSNGSTATSNPLCDPHCRVDNHETDAPTELQFDSNEISEFHQFQCETTTEGAFSVPSAYFGQYYEVKQLMDLIEVFDFYVPFLLKPLGSAQRSARVLVAYEQFAQIKAAGGKLIGIQSPTDFEHVGKFISSLHVTAFSVPTDPSQAFELPTDRPLVNPHFPSTPPCDPELTPPFHAFFAYSSRFIIPSLQLLETVLKVTNNGGDVDDDDDSSLALKGVPALINIMLEGIPAEHPLRAEITKYMQPFRHLIPRIDL